MSCRSEILGGHTEVSDAVNRPVITVTGVGKVARGDLLSTGGMQPGDELVMTKWAGLEGSAIIAAEKRDVLEQTLPAHLIDTAESFLKHISVVPEAKIAMQHGVHAMHDVTEGGILAHCGRWAQHRESVSLQILIKYRSVRRQ